MDQNDKNNKNRRGNRNLLGAVKLVAWALVLTLVFYCTSSYMGSAGKQASNINIKYSDFIAMMESKQVEDVTVDLSEGLLYIVPKDGYVYAAENGTAYTKSTDQDGKAVYAFTDADGKEHTAALKLFTVKMESNDTLVERMHEAGKTDYDTKYEPQMSPLLLFASEMDVGTHVWVHLLCVVTVMLTASSWSSALCPRAIRFSRSIRRRFLSMCRPVWMASEADCSRKMRPMLWNSWRTHRAVSAWDTARCVCVR